MPLVDVSYIQLFMVLSARILYPAYVCIIIHNTEGTESNALTLN